LIYVLQRSTAPSFLTDEHIQKIFQAYVDFDDVPGLAKKASLDEISANNHSLNINLYVNKYIQSGSNSFEDSHKKWINSTDVLSTAIHKILLKGSSNA
tara:strand:+ start:8 stop:301 length:294 start_codon:yes stop_codon:yes gene_type:complete